MHRKDARRLLAAVFLAVLLLPAATAQGYSSFIADLKATGKDFTPGTQATVPVYFVENRAAVDPTIFRTHRLRSIVVEFTTMQSKFASFTPVSGFDVRGMGGAYGLTPQYVNKVIDDDKGVSHLILEMRSTAGIEVPVDASGITGRSELLIGTMKIDVGPSVEWAGHNLVMDVTSAGSTSSRSMITTFRPDGGVYTPGFLETRQMRFFDDDPSVPDPDPDPEPGPDPGTGAPGGGAPAGGAPGGGAPGGGAPGGGAPGGGAPAGGAPAGGAPTAGGGASRTVTPRCTAARTALTKATTHLRAAQRTASKRAADLRRAKPAKRAAARLRSARAKKAVKLAEKARTKAEGQVKQGCA